MPLLRELADELPRLEAAETLRMATAIAIGTGSLERDALRSAVRDLEREAGLVRPLSREGALAAAAALGIKVVREPAGPTA